MVNLHCHTEYSLLDGLCRIKDLVARAKALGQPAVAITDHGNLHGMVKFYEQCQQNSVKPIIGCEVYVTPDRLSKTKDARNFNFHLVLLARTNDGLRNLISIVSDASTKGFYQKPRTDLAMLARHGKGIIGLSACRGGEIPHLLLHGQFDTAADLARIYSSIFDRFYLEVQGSDAESQRVLNAEIARLADATGLPLVATNDAHYMSTDDFRVHDVLLAIQTGKNLMDPNRLRFDGDYYWFKDASQTASYLSHSIQPAYIEESISNTLGIADACSVSLELGRVLFPEVEVPAGKTMEQYLRDVAYEGLRSLVNDFGVDYETYKARLDYELKVIIDANLGGYFLMVRDIYEFAKARNIPRGPARGSAGGCLLARCLGITQIDPMKHDLPFERFWVPGRVGMPDIDCDFSPDRRAELFQYVIDKYGQEHCAHIGTFGTMNPRMLIRDVGRVLMLPLHEVDLVAKAVPEMLSDPDSGERVDVTIDAALEESEELQRYSEIYPELFDLARKLEGIPRHTSVHAAGILIAPEPIFDKIPLLRSKDETDPLPITQLDMGDVEKLGYLKMDLLGVDALTVIDECLRIIKSRYGMDIDLLKIPFDDKQVFENIKSCRTLGMFQICTPIGKQICSQVQPENFDELVDILALARPGPMKSGQDREYVIHKLGVKPVTYIHPDLESILSPTYGVMLYQEQLMAISRVMAGFDHSEADKVRKGIAKKLPEVLHELRDKFIQGCVARGTLSESDASDLWSQMEKYGGYVFNKAHACAYAYITYWTAWLKTYYPTEFMAATLTNEYRGSGDDRDQKIVDAMIECRRLGIRILQPNVNESIDRFTVTPMGNIRFPLTGIKGIGEKVAQAIMAYAPYADLEDFLARVPKRQCNKKAVTCLILAGAFDAINPDRLELLYELAQTTAHPKKGPEIPSEFKLDAKTTLKIPKAYTLKDKLDWEKACLGAYISGHPLDELGLDTWRDKRPGDKVTVAGVVYARRKLQVKRGRSKGRDMSIANIDTTEGQLTVVLFPDQHDEFGSKVRKNSTIKVRGTLEYRDDGTWQVIASDVTNPRIKGFDSPGGTYDAGEERVPLEI